MVPAGVISAEADAGYPVAVEYQTGETPGGEVVAPDYSYPGYVVEDDEYESGNDYADYEVDYDYDCDYDENEQEEPSPAPLLNSFLILALMIVELLF